MSQAVKISDEEMLALREAAGLNSRSISGQAEHWLRIGRAVERNPEYGYVKIERALKGLLPVSQLSGSEQEEFFDRFDDVMVHGTAAEDAYWDEQRRVGVGVGLDEKGNLVVASKAD